ncbi:E3 ubiquitin/ISG15 ligase TRIM25-like [Rhinoderma darwinii]|uniref:E3 ubiquitin/ISG15 ligase TRIM25-like n=1 Tax=Rhinoderma darwinii TaxID=43563 RepID=UPI003F668238
MASADLRDELNCAICLNLYTDPVNLSCGHNFCRTCIVTVLDTQQRCRHYSCPQCRAAFHQRPVLQSNVTLRNIAEHFTASTLGEGQSGISCTYCVHYSVLAVKSCVLCEASLCETHLRVHSKAAEHVLIEASASLQNRKCSIHRKILEYYCTEDALCICAFCAQSEQHKGHQEKTMNEASEEKKKNLRNVLHKLKTNKENVEERVRSLRERRRKLQKKASEDTERVTSLFRDLKRQLDDLEKSAQREVSRQHEKVSLSVSDLIQQLKGQEEEFSRKIAVIEELCHMTDPLRVLQEPDITESDTKESDIDSREGFRQRLRDTGHVIEAQISRVLNKGLDDIMSSVKSGIYVDASSDILLDVDTAGGALKVSHDLKSVSWSERNIIRPNVRGRFTCSQVLSTRSFSSGRHFWEVESSESGLWMMGVTYPSIDRQGDGSIIGSNEKSWSLSRLISHYSVRHDKQETNLSRRSSGRRLGVFLDYEAGRLSFYELSDPMRHLHTFTAAFSEPLHAAFWVFIGGALRIRHRKDSGIISSQGPDS